MGYARRRPERLGGKLRQIRLSLDLSQSGMLRRLEAEDMIALSQISQYETGAREPPLEILLQYARLANLYLEVLVDDELDLPDQLPAATKSEGIRRKTATRARKR
jgi:transcriptional regulator with XRE-family HTH domain